MTTASSVCHFYLTVNSVMISQQFSHSANYTLCDYYTYRISKNSSSVYRQYYVLEVIWLASILPNSQKQTVECDKDFIDVTIGDMSIQRFCYPNQPYPLYSHNQPINITHQRSRDTQINVTIATRLIYTQNRSIGYRNSFCRNTYPSTSHGVLFSPRYPYGYKADTKCTYKIKVGKRKKVVLTFMDMMLSPYGFVCNERDDNVRIKGASNYDMRFEYAQDVDTNRKYICGTHAPFTVEVASYEFVLLQFKSSHSTVIHRGFVVGFQTKDYEGASYSREQVVVALIATAVGVVFISILGVIAYFIKKNKLFHLLKTSARQSSVISIDICEDDEMCAANLERLNELFRASGQS